MVQSSGLLISYLYMFIMDYACITSQIPQSGTVPDALYLLPFPCPDARSAVGEDNRRGKKKGK